MRKGEKNVEVSRIQVFARCRPFNGIEQKQDSVSVVEVFPKEKKVAVKDRNKEFTFDKVFQPDVKQIDVYKSVAEPLIQEVLKGFNCTILAYGQTGTGKTYTMEGTRNNSQCSWEDDPGAGLIPRSLHQLFEELNKGDNVEFSVRVSFLELYNEELIDLLSSKDDRLRIYENASKKGSVHIDGLEEVVVNTKDEVYAILKKGTNRRQTASTLLNASSSRSHTVFSVTVHIKENTTDGEELVKTGKLNLVDLAGSECVGRSGCVNQRFREASNINMSLLTLGRVITALIENQPHVPYRESKLTRLLQDSLGGHTKTSFIATISPAQCNLEETMSTLEYATKAKNITNKPVINEKMTKRALIRELTDEIERLRKDLSALRNGEGYYVDAQNYAQMEKKISETKDKITETEDKIKLLEEEVEVLKQQNREIEQTLTLTKEELHKKTKQHEETVSKLTDVSETLCNTEKELSKTAIARDENAYLLNIHRNKEKQLFEQNNKLHLVVNESTEDLNKLHMKVERKQKVETTNEERCKQFKQSCHKQFAYLDDLVTDSRSAQESKLGNLKEIIDNSANGFMNHCQQNTHILNKIDTELSNLLEDFSLSLSNEATEREKVSNLLLENMDAEKNSLMADQNTFWAEYIQSFKEKFSNMIAEKNNLFLNNQYLVLQKIDNFRNQIKVQLKERCKCMGDITSNIQAFIQHHTSLLNALGEKIQVYSSQQSDAMEELNKLKLQMDKVVKSFSLKEDFSLIEEMHQNIQKSVPDLIAAEESSQKHFETYEKEIATNLTSLDDISSSVTTTEFTSQLDSVVSFHNSEASEIATIIKNDQQKQESFVDRIKDEIVTNEIVTQSNYETKKCKLKEIQGTVSENIKSNILHLDVQRNDILNVVSGAKAIIKRSKQELQKNSQELSKQILQRDIEIEKFISEDLEKDIPTGATPQRKTYCYPKELIHLSPDDEKLHSLRRLRGEYVEKAVTLNLPMDSSFDESDEFKSPLNQGFCDVTVENIAQFNNADEYLTDCETLSNASSTSDLSVTGFKNKENLKSFPKPPSHNIPKVKKVKKKVDSSIPTPTQRKPLSYKNPSVFSA